TYPLPESVDGLWADPARRTGSKRVFNPKAFTPPLDDVLALRDSYPALGMKLAPGIPHEALPENAETQWISTNGTVVEAAVWCGPLANDNITRSALILSSDTDTGAGQTSTLITDADPSHREQVPAGEVGTWVHEPDGAVIRAGLVGAVADEVSGHLLDESIAYVTTDEDVTSPAATRYRVEDVFPFNLKKLRFYLRERDVGAITIKKRGTAITPEELRKKPALFHSGTGRVGTPDHKPRHRHYARRLTHKPSAERFPGGNNYFDSHCRCSTRAYCQPNRLAGTPLTRQDRGVKLGFAHSRRS